MYKCALLSFKGRGVVATSDIVQGQFLAEYRGELISEAELEIREAETESVFRYTFSWKGKNLW